MRNWNWIGLRQGGQAPELLPMKAGKSISNVVMNAGNMLRGEGKIKAGSCRKLMTEETHNTGDLGRPGT